MKADAFELFKSEVELMSDLGEHPNIGNVIEVFQDPCSYHLVQPYYCGGNLEGLKTRAVCAGVVPTADWWSSIFSQCLTGLAHMHSQDVMHCDIKEPNIMLRTEDLSNPEVVIIDLGIAQRASTQRKMIYGTPGYIPPEVWETKNWCPESDMFSLGVVVLQLLMGKMGIFVEKTRTYKEVEEATKQRLPPFELMPIEFPVFRGLAQKLLEKDFRARPTAASLLQGSWEDCHADQPSEAAAVLNTTVAQALCSAEHQLLRFATGENKGDIPKRVKSSPAQFAPRVKSRPVDCFGCVSAVGIPVPVEVVRRGVPVEVEVVVRQPIQ